MEFFLVPMVAIVLVTYAIYKLTALVFHIHLSRGLLCLLVVFAWLVSFVLPGLFFQTVGFLGSVGISLVSALGFAWIATTYETRHQPEPIAVGSASTEPHNVEIAWIPSAENSFPITNEVPAPNEDAAENSSTYGALPSDVQDNIWSDTENIAAISDALIFDDNEPEVLLADDLPTIEPSVAELPSEMLPPDEVPQPDSDSLEDLLDFAFLQKERRNLEGALTAFRLVQALYVESSSIPLVLAEIVNLLQSEGRYDEAIQEVAKSLEIAGIRNDQVVLNTFEQKMRSLQALQNYLQERGMPRLPYDQVPAEWDAV